jgi:hypothetical protein
MCQSSFINFPPTLKNESTLVTSMLYAYKGLPMGAGTSPGLACRHGMGFLCALKTKCDAVFKGEGKANCCWTSFTDLGFDAEKWYGSTLHYED